MASRALTVLALACLQAPAVVAQQGRDLSGRWVLEGGRPAVDSAPPVPPAPPLERRREVDRAMRQVGLLLGMAGAVPSFTIEQTDSSITVTNEDGFRYALRPGGGEQRFLIADSIEVRYRTRWDGAFLQVEWRPAGGGKVTERYQLADSGLYLRVDTSVEYERFRRAESRLYRKADDES